MVREVDPYTPPELVKNYLAGFVFGDSRRDDGTDITTSRIIGKRNGSVVTRSGSEYELDDVDPKYEELFPDAKNRLLNSLKEI